MTGPPALPDSGLEPARTGRPAARGWSARVVALGAAAGAAALVAVVVAHPVPQPGPSPEQAWILLAASCTSPAAHPYRGAVPSVRQDGPGRYLVTAGPPAPSSALTVRYDRQRGFGAVDTLRPATRGDDARLAELGCAPLLVWSALPPG